MKKQILFIPLIVCTLLNFNRISAQCLTPWFTNGNTIGVYSHILGTLDANDVNLTTDNTQVGIITGATGPTGNFEIGINGTYPQNKLLVENGGISGATGCIGASGPYADLCPFGLHPSDIGIYSYSNNTSSGNNIGAASVVDATRPFQIGYMALVNNASNTNAGMFFNINSSTTGVHNNGITGTIGATGGNNTGVAINITDNNSSAVNKGANFSLTGTGGTNTGVIATIADANSGASNLGASISISGDNANNNSGVNVEINANNAPNTGISSSVVGTGTFQNFGLHTSVYGAASNTGVGAFVGQLTDNGETNIGVQGNAIGGSNGTNRGTLWNFQRLR